MSELSELVNSVSKPQRTDGFLVLAALFHLKAHATPVTKRQIEEALRLAVPKKDMPSNVGTSLSRLKGSVSLKATNPHTWLLTKSGLTLFHSLTGLSAPAETRRDRYSTDVAFICALETPEHDALVDALGGPSNWKEQVDGNLTHVFRHSGIRLADGRKLTVVGTTATTMGLTAAAIATTQTIMLFRPRLVVMVGIAAGTRTGQKEFGDVLVADPSVDYNSGKVVESNGVREFQPDPYPIGLHPRIRTLLNRYAGRMDALAGIRAQWKETLPERGNRLHLGPLGAADQVIDDHQRILEIQKDWRKLVGVEMETYAVYRACQEAPEPKPRFVSFKSVCDFAAAKSDSWQRFAAFIAARFAVHFVKTEWDALWSPATEGVLE
jgi:nucleoside phosphorylase